MNLLYSMFGREREPGFMADIAKTAASYGVPAVLLTELAMGTAQARELEPGEKSKVLDQIREIKEKDGQVLAGSFDFAGKTWTVRGAELHGDRASKIAFVYRYEGSPDTTDDNITVYSSYTYRGELPEHTPGTPNKLVEWQNDWRYGSKEAFQAFRDDLVAVGQEELAIDDTTGKKGNVVQQMAIGLASLNARALLSSEAQDAERVMHHVHGSRYDAMQYDVDGKGWWQGKKEPWQPTGGPSFSVSFKETPHPDHHDRDTRFDYQRSSQGGVKKPREIRNPDVEITVDRNGVHTAVSEDFAEKRDATKTEDSATDE